MKTPNAKAIKTSLKKFYGISALRCRIINGAMFINVNPEQTESIINFFNEFNICHSTGVSPIPSSVNGTTEFANLMIKS